MKSVKIYKNKGYHFKHTIIYSLSLLLVFNTCAPLALATPNGADVVAGSAAVNQAANTTTVTMDSARAVINWDSLNTSQNEVLEFLKAGGNFAVLNRVVQGGATDFRGSLFGNQGHIIIVNPQGIVFGPTALVQAYKFTASGLNITNSDFMNGIYRFAGGSGTVSNYGNIAAQQVSLIGQKILNAGTITSPNGYVIMAAGDKVFLGNEGSDVVVEVDSVSVPDPTDPASEGIGDVINEGTIEAAGGKIVLAAGDTFSRAIEGLDSLTVAVDGGTGRVGQFGTLSVDGIDGDAGSITLAAGGDVTLASESLTTANAAASGQGGDVLVLAGDTATINSSAQIQAKGGSLFGDGGFIEISGEHFILAGDIDASATDGKPGTLILDPPTLTVANGSGAPALDTVYEQDIEAVSQAGTNVDLVADDSITVENISDNTIQGGSGSISFYATEDDSSIAFNDNADTISTITGDITMSAGGGGINIGNLETGHSSLTESPGTITLITYNGGNIQTGYLNATGGTDALIAVDSAGTLQINGDSPHGAVMAITNSVPLSDQASAAICLKAAGDMTINGKIEAVAHGKIETTTKIHICSGGDVDIDTANGQIHAFANTSNEGTADATISVHAAGSTTIDRNGNSDPIRAQAWAKDDKADVSSDGSEDDEQTIGNAHAQIEIEPAYQGECPDCVDRQDPPLPPPLPGDPPIAVDDSYEVDENGTLTVELGEGILINDIGGGPLTAILVDLPAHGILILQPDGSLVYIPDPDYNGLDSFTYLATDGELYSEVATVNIFIKPVSGTLPPGPSSPMSMVPPAPIAKPIEFEMNGCPVLLAWLANEIGISEQTVHIYVEHVVLMSSDINPCDMCARLIDSVAILADPDGSRADALAQVINEFVAPDAPISEENLALINAALENHFGNDTHYVVAKQWMDAFVDYIDILNGGLGWPLDEAIAFVMEKYAEPITNSSNEKLIAYFEANFAP